MKRLAIGILVVVCLWIGVRLAVAVRVPGPSYVLKAGDGCIREQWCYLSRFRTETDIRKLTAIALVGNRIKNTLFRVSMPFFAVENRLLGASFDKGDPAVRQYVARVALITTRGWEEVVSPGKDGRDLEVIKDRQVVETIH